MMLQSQTEMLSSWSGLSKLSQFHTGSIH